MYSVEEREWVLYVLSEVGSYLAASKVTGVSDKTVRAWAEAAGAPRPPRKPPVRLPAADRLRYARRLEAGERSADLAAEAGVTRQAVCSWLRALRGKGALVFADDDELAAAAGEAPPPPGGEGALLARNRELELRVAVLEAKLEILKKDPGADASALTSRERAALVDSLRARFPLPALLAEAGIPRSTYYHARAASARPDPLAWLKPLVREVFERSRGRYGAARVWAGIRRMGLSVSEKVVRRAMRELGLEARSSASAGAPYSSYAPGLPGEAPNMLLADEGRDLHDFSAERPGERIVTDITEFRLGGRRVYLSPAVDLFDGRVVAWRAGTSPDAALACGMLADALGAVGGPFLVHSDRGVHYRTREWLRMCRESGVVRSMSRKGHSPDNAAMEGFFGRLKVELFRGRDWEGVSVEGFLAELEGYVSWYNSGRLKAFREGGRTVYDTIDGRRRRLGLAA